MEYTNDVIFNVRYKKDEIKTGAYTRHKRLKKLIKKIEDDEFFTFTLIVSAVVLFVDYLIIKEFITTINLL